MPKKVDHQQRRGEIASAVARIAADRGLQGVSFREVAAEAGVSVSLVQHYFGTKENLLIGTLDIQSARLAELIRGRLDAARPDDHPLGHLRVIVNSFLPTDDETRAAMLLYHAFAAAALTDPELRRADAFTNADGLVTVIAQQLDIARDAGRLADGIDPTIEARAILSLVLGASLSILLDQVDPREAATVLDAHLDRLVP